LVKKCSLPLKERVEQKIDVGPVGD
jgi:hypothetical protein